MIVIRGTLVLVASTCLFSGVAHSAPLPSRSVEIARISQRSPDSINEARAKVAQCIVDTGIPTQQAAERTALLSDDDVVRMADHADQLRAAGGLNRWQIAAIVVGGILLHVALFLLTW